MMFVITSRCGSVQAANISVVLVVVVVLCEPNLSSPLPEHPQYVLEIADFLQGGYTPQRAGLCDRAAAMVAQLL